MKMKTRWITLLLSLASLAACGGRQAQAASAEEETQLSAATEYEIGDIVFADGTVGKEAELTAVDSRNLPVAVIAGFRADGTAWGVGVHRSGGPLPWAAAGTVGYGTRFSELVCTQNPVHQSGSAASFSGDLDSSDNWSVICETDGQGTENAAENYPAYEFVNTYAERWGLTGACAFGWYMPGIQELCTLYQNREAVDASLQKICRLNPDGAMDGLGTNWYWSSSQADSADDYVWFVHYFNGYAGECPKDFTNLHVIAVHEF